MKIDGHAIAAGIYKQLRGRVAAFSRRPRLGIIVGPEDPVIESFVRIKSKAAHDLGVEIVRKNLPKDASTESVMMAVRDFDSAIDGLIVQLPLPARIDTNAVLSEIPKSKDVDGINPIVSDNERIAAAPVALAVMEILRRTNVDPRGKRAVVVGAGRLVGSPAAAILKENGANVSIFTLDTGKIDDLKDADIIVLGAGNPGLVLPEHIKDGVVLIDAGTSEVAGVLRGDADPACAKKASVFTPVPGGVGPISVAMIFQNLLDLAKKRRAA